MTKEMEVIVLTDRAKLIGEHFGQWTVDSWCTEKRKWKVICTCGNIGYAPTYVLRGGKSTRCIECRSAAVGHKNSTHNMSKTSIFHVWNAMRGRCNNKNNHKYYRYGARGIKVCDKWNDFNVFYEWAISNGYQEGLQIDRINNDGNYCPDNCRWVTYQENANNTSQNVKITFNGITKTMSQWARDVNLKVGTLKRRLRFGWSIERALTEKAFVGKNQSYKRAVNVE